ncbi:MAG: BrnT family toxin [Candidatus Binatia bacterium]
MTAEPEEQAAGPGLEADHPPHVGRPIVLLPEGRHPSEEAPPSLLGTAPGLALLVVMVCLGGRAPSDAVASAPAWGHHARVEQFHLLSYISVVRFVWDTRKAAANFKKHGISFEEASTAFQDERGAYFPDTLQEDRFILIGYSRQQRLLYVVHAEVTPDAIRIISARKATRHERTRYENG